MQNNLPYRQGIVVYQDSKNRQTIQQNNDKSNTVLLSEQQNIEILYRFMITNVSLQFDKDIQEFRLQMKTSSATSLFVLQTIISQIEPNFDIKSFSDERIYILLKRLGFSKFNLSRTKQQTLGNPTSFLNTIKIMAFLALKAEQFQTLSKVIEKRNEQTIMKTQSDMFIHQNQQFAFKACSMQMTQEDQKYYNKFLNEQKLISTHEKQEIQNQMTLIQSQYDQLKLQLDKFKFGHKEIEELLQQKSEIEQQISFIEEQTLQLVEQSNSYQIEGEKMQLEAKTKIEIKQKLEQDFKAQLRDNPNICELAEQQYKLMPQLNLIAGNCDIAENQLKSQQLQLMEQQAKIQSLIIKITITNPKLILSNVLFTSIVEQNKPYILYQGNKIDVSVYIDGDTNQKLINMLLQPITNIIQNMEEKRIYIITEQSYKEKEKISAQNIQAQKLLEKQQLRNKNDQMAFEINQIKAKIEILDQKIYSLQRKNQSSQNLKTIIVNLNTLQSQYNQQIKKSQADQVRLKKKFKYLLQFQKDILQKHKHALTEQEIDHRKLLQWNTRQIQQMISAII